MKKELKKRWIAALKSGKYGKTKCELVDESGLKYCCLGVLGRVGGLSVADLRNMISRPSPHMHANVNDKLSTSMLNTVGLTWEQQDALADLNDKTDTFAEVIAFIKANV